MGLCKRNRHFNCSRKNGARLEGIRLPLRVALRVSVGPKIDYWLSVERG